MDKKEALKIVKKNCNKLENLPAQFKKDKEIGLEAVKKDGFAFISFAFIYFHNSL